MTLDALSLTQAQVKALHDWRNGWGHVWKAQLSRFWGGVELELDAHYAPNKRALHSTKNKIQDVLDKLKIPYTGTKPP